MLIVLHPQLLNMAVRPNLSLLLFLFLASTPLMAMAMEEQGNKNFTQLHFFVHDTFSGPDPTAIKVVRGPVKYPGTNFNFGDIVVFDDPLTEGPSLNSKVIGRAHGSYVFASKSTANLTLLLTLNVVLTDGEYGGSTFSVVASDAIFAPVVVVELPIVGGSGMLRMAHGYARSKTYSYNTTTDDAIYEVDAYLFHLVM